MRIIIALVLAAACVLFLCGCCGSPQGTPEQKAQAAVAKETEQFVKLLPPEHKNLKSLGNQWFSYELEVGGAKRQFMARYWCGSHGEVGIAVTELK